jgi:hypothetical protein
MNGKIGPGMAEPHDYRAVVRITDKDGTVRAAVGQPCDAVDPAALAWLLACGAIAPVVSEEPGPLGEGDA